MDLSPDILVNAGGIVVFAFVVWKTVVKIGDSVVSAVKELVKPMMRLDRRVTMVLERQRVMADRLGMRPRDLPHDDDLDNGSRDISIPPTRGAR